PLIVYMTWPAIALDNSTVINYFLPDIRDVDLLESLPTDPNVPFPGALDRQEWELWFIVAEPRLEDLLVLDERFPDGAYTEHYSPQGDFLFGVYRTSQ
ncbi:MAG: hypothetical protein GYB68_17145, partial [Chloroflexi bacterium]|nr:hypothetical protein [Chloroflexota bacterium]